MARVAISGAIEVGAPAYNAGEIAMCAEVYTQVASQLLSAHRRELKSSVIRVLEEALSKAASMGQLSNGRGSDTDALAWSLRRAFDEQLQAPSGGARGEGDGGESAGDIIAAAIARGAPAYNSGNVSGCEEIYKATVRQLLDSQGLLDDSSRQVLERALQQCRQLPDADARAWALRRGLDAMRGGGSGGGSGGVRAAAGSSGGKSGAAVLRDFARDQGLSVTSGVVNDTVMGGRSQSRLSVTRAGALFEGEVTRRGGGGFASVRFVPADPRAFAQLLRSGTGIAFTVRCSRGCPAWKVQLTERGGMFQGSGTQWQADFTAPEQEGKLKVPFASLRPSWRGQPAGSPGLSADGLENIASFGFMLSFLTAAGGESRAFYEGPFALTIVSVEVY